MLEIRGLRVSYGPIEVLHGVDLSVREGAITTLIGANGAGKSTLLRAISGLVRASDGEIRYDGRDVRTLAPERIVAAGLTHCPEGRHVFPEMTVRENLDLGAFRRRDARGVRESLTEVYGLFPRLQERCEQRAGTLSGGEQQMLAIGRALMSRPRLLLLDEPSLGIAPNLVRQIFSTIVAINRDAGVTIFLVEQNANMALRFAETGYVLETGRIVLTDTAENLRSSNDVRRAYLGG
jgi:branched-chain amino acid transport system ATP-binding protein